MKYGTKAALGLAAALTFGANVLFTPSNALAKSMPKTAPPVPVQIFQKEKDKIENIDKSKITSSSSSARLIHGLSVEPATTSALVRRLSHAQVIIQGMNHTFDLGRDKGTQLLRQLRDPLNIGAVLMEELRVYNQDSLTMFCTSGQMNGMVSRVAGVSVPRGAYSDYSLVLLLAEARSMDMELVAMGPDDKQPKYVSPFLWRDIPVYQYVTLANDDMAAKILEYIKLHPGQRVWVQTGSAHVAGLQKILGKAGIISSSLEVWGPGIPNNLFKKEAADDWLTPILNRNTRLCRRYLSLLRDCGDGEFLVANPKQKLSTLVDFVFYTNEQPYNQSDYRARLKALLSAPSVDMTVKAFSEYKANRDRILMPSRGGEPIPNWSEAP